MSMNYVYCRISTDKQSDESLERQEEICRKWVSEPITVVHEIGSGNNQNRPKLQEILKHLQSDDCLCIRDNSRLARNMLGSLVILNTITEKGAHLICDGKVINPDNPQDMFTFNVHSAFSDFQRTIQAQKAKEGQQKMFSEGDWVFCSTLFGYELTKKGKAKIVSVVPDEAKVIRFIFEKYSSGWSVKKLLGELQGLPLQRQSNFTLKKISRILQQPIYMGFYPDSTIDNKVLPRYTKSELEGHLVKSNVYPPIVSEEIWWTCYERYRTVTPTHSRPWELRFTVHTLSGIIKCEKCGKGIARFTRLNGFYCVEDHTFDCPTKYRGKYDATWLEHYVETIFYATFMFGDEVGSFFGQRQQELFNDKKDINKSLVGIDHELSEVKTKISRLIDAISDGLITKDEANNRLNSLRNEQKELEDRRLSLKQDLRQIEVNIDALIELSSSEIIDTFYNHKRDYYKRFIDKALIYNDHIFIQFMNGRSYSIKKPFRHNHIIEDVTVTSTYKDDTFQFVYSLNGPKLIECGVQEYDNYISDILRKAWSLVIEST